MRDSKNIPLAAPLFLVLLLAVRIEAQEIRFGSGELLAVDKARRSVVVDIPWGTQMLTVAGTFGSDPELKSGGRKIALGAFQPGDIVRIGWKRTPNGHEIAESFP